MTIPRSATVTVVAAALAVSASASSYADRPHPAVVRENPANSTPHLVPDDTGKQPRILALARRRGTIYAGGLFRRVTGPQRNHVKARRNLFAFNAGTGKISRSFTPRVNGPIWALQTTRNHIFIGGGFTRVNGVRRVGLARLDRRTGEVVRSFKAPFRGGRVTEVAFARGRLMVGGTFPRKLIALRPKTGRATRYVKPRWVTGKLPDSEGRRPGVFRFAVDRDKRRLVAVGNFTHVAGRQRDRAFMLNLRKHRARLNRWWYQPLAKRCEADGPTRQAYLHDVAFSPNGNYFVFVSTGFVPEHRWEIGTMICDAAARFETDVRSPSEPTWINYTGGDTLHSVAVTGAAVYVQGHSRWLDNPYGRNDPGPGAVERKGGGAIHPVTGDALPWNPVMPNRIGGYDFMATRHGLWIARDGRRIGGEYHRGLAFMPLP